MFRHTRPFVLGVFLASIGCTSEPRDAEFESAWVDDFESDEAEDAAEAAEQAEVDQLGDEADLDGNSDATAPGALTKSRTKGGEGSLVAAHGPLSIIQDDVWFSGERTDGLAKVYDEDLAEERLAEARALGAKVVRVVVRWGAVAPHADSERKPKGFVASRPADYDFRALDAEVIAARRVGLGVLLTLSAAEMPLWGSEDPAECLRRTNAGLVRACAYKPIPKEYAQFVTAVGRHVKAKEHAVWAWSFAHEPTMSERELAGLRDPEGAMASAFRYRRMWFAARKHLRVTAGIAKARVLFGDVAFDSRKPGAHLSPSSPHWSFVPWSMCLKTEWNPSLVDGSYRCPARPRKVHALGFAFHPWAPNPTATIKGVSFLGRLLDEAAQADRIAKAPRIYLTEGGFATARSSGEAVTVEQQAISNNQAEHFLADNPRVKATAQTQLVDEGYGLFDSGLRYARASVLRKDGPALEGDLLEVVRGSHVRVQPDVGEAVTVPWASLHLLHKNVPLLMRTGMGHPKPADAAYRIAFDARREGDQIHVWGHARSDTGAGMLLQAFREDTGWMTVGVIPTDSYGYGRGTFGVLGAQRWRLTFGPEYSRESSGAEPPAANWTTGATTVLGPELFGINTSGLAGNLAGHDNAFTREPLPNDAFGAIRWWDDPAGTYSTKWCDLQPDASTDLEASFRNVLDPKLQAAKAQGVRRIVMVLGHAAPWVFDAGHKEDSSIWFCKSDPAAKALPDPAWLGTEKNPGPGRERFSRYVTSLLQHLHAVFPDGLPFELAFQTWNEPTTAEALVWKFPASMEVPHAAATLQNAVDALLAYESIVRAAIDHTPGVDKARIKLFTSPITRADTSVSERYLSGANALALARRAGRSSPFYDGFSFQTYSLQGTTPKSADALIAEYEVGTAEAPARIVGISAALQEHQGLVGLPRFQTETNHGLAFTAETRALNAAPSDPTADCDAVTAGSSYSRCDRGKLMARLMLTALRFDLSGQFLYAFGGDQYPLHFGPTDTGVATDDSYTAFDAVRRWLVGREFLGCTVAGGLVDCMLSPASPDGGVQHVVYADSASGASYVVPNGVASATEPNGKPSTPVVPGATVSVNTTPTLFR